MARGGLTLIGPPTNSLTGSLFLPVLLKLSYASYAQWVRLGQSGLTMLPKSQSLFHQANGPVLICQDTKFWLATSTFTFGSVGNPLNQQQAVSNPDLSDCSQRCSRQAYRTVPIAHESH